MSLRLAWSSPSEAEPPCAGAFAALGPAFCALGLYLSTRVDLLPARDCLALARLPDHASALPAVAMLFTGEVDWGPGDFLAMGAMLLVACSACELAARLLARPAHRVAAFVAIAAAFLLTWAELAVGIFH